MPKKILIINSNNLASEFLGILQEFNPDIFNFILAGDAKTNWRVKKLTGLSILNQKNNSVTFLICLPLFYIFFFFVLASAYWQEKYSAIVCFNNYEKIIFTPTAKLLGLKIFWFFEPETDLMKTNKLILKLLQFCARWAKILVPAEYTKNSLVKLGFNADSINFIPLAVNLKAHRRQENIFSNIAATESRWPQRKYFTIGTVCDLNQKQNIEVLFNATKKILDVISYPQVIIVGEGKERKNLTLLAKRMGIENYIWFVGEQSHLKKWLDSFDVFVTTASIITLKDLSITIRALASGLPIIGPDNINLEELILDNENGLIVKPDDSEALAQALIKMQQRKDWRRQIGEKNKNKVATDFNIDNTLSQLNNLFND